MKKLSKIICLSLSMMLLIETAGMNVRAADVNNDTTQEVSETVETEKEPDADVPEDVTDVPSDDASKEDENVADDVTDDSSDTAIIDDSTLVEEEGESEEQLPEDEAVIEEQLETEETTDETNTITKEVVSTPDGFRVMYSGAKDGDYCKLFKKTDGNYNEVMNTDIKFQFNSNGIADIPNGFLNQENEFKIVAYLKNPVSQPQESSQSILSEEELETLGTDTYQEQLVAEGVKYTIITIGEPIVGEGKVELNWNNVNPTSDYEISYVAGKSGEVTGGVTSSKDDQQPKVIIEKLIRGIKYTFTVRAKIAENVFAEASTDATTLFNDVPGVVTGFKGTPGISQVILTWNQITGTSGYVIEKYVSGKWVQLSCQTQSIKTYTDKVTEGQTYQYRICTYLNAKPGQGKAIVNYGGYGVKYSAYTQISVYVPKYEKVIPMQFNGKIKSKAPFFSTASSKKKLGYLKKGTPYKTLDVSGDRFYCQLKDGRKVWVAKKRMNFTKQYWTKKDYTRETKERFVNSRNISSKTKYMLWTSFYTQKANVFTGYKGNWKLIRVCPVSTGDAKHNSAMGMKTLYKKSKGWFRKSYYVKPVYYFSGANAFHSRLHKYKGGYKDGGVGRPLTNGCIRMNDPDIQWIYKNCPLKTRVYNY